MAEGSRLCGGREPIRPWNAKAGIIRRRIGFLRAKRPRKRPRMNLRRNCGPL
jgi:hypothetical protein